MSTIEEDILNVLKKAKRERIISITDSTPNIEIGGIHNAVELGLMKRVSIASYSLTKLGDDYLLEVERKSEISFNSTPNNINIIPTFIKNISLADWAALATVLGIVIVIWQLIFGHT